MDMILFSVASILVVIIQLVISRSREYHIDEGGATLSAPLSGNGLTNGMLARRGFLGG